MIGLPSAELFLHREPTAELQLQILLAVLYDGHLSIPRKAVVIHQLRLGKTLVELAA